MYLMKKTLLTVLIMLIMISSAQAKAMYVRDRANINLRRSPSENASIVGLADTNDYLEIKEETGYWARVQTPDGQEGWVPLRLLTTETPRVIIIDQLNAKIKSLNDTIMTLQGELQGIKKQNLDLNSSMNSLNEAASKSQQDYQQLRASSSDVIKLDTEYKKLVEKDKLRSAEMADLAKENSRLRTSERIMFTLVGGGFILLGAILGPLTQGLRGGNKKSGYKI